MRTFELTLRLQGFPIDVATKALNNISQKSPEELYDWQERKKWEIFNHHYDNNAHYRKFVGNIRPEKWEDIPEVNKKDFQVPIALLLTKGYTKKNVYLANTSGSSGHPFYFAKDKFSHAISWAMLRKCYQQYDIDLNAPQARFYGIPYDKKAYYIEQLKDRLANRVRFPVFDLSDKVLDSFVKKFSTKKFEYIYGYTSSLVYFSRYLINKGVILKDVCPTLKVCIVTSEMCLEEDKELLRKGLGIKVANEYGSSELSVMGFENPNGEMICSDELTFFENVAGADGNTKLLSTALHNKAFPLIKYNIGDIVTIDYNAEGRKFISKITGRVNDFVKLPSGKVAAGLTFYYVFRSVLESTGCLKEFIIRQTQIDTFVLDVVATEKLKKAEIDNITMNMEKYLEEGLSIEINYVEEIPRKANGKIQHFYSEI